MKLKNLLATALVGVMMLGASLGVCAADYPKSYVQGTTYGVPTSEAVNVTVTVEGLTTPYTEMNVSLPAKANGEIQHVNDALLAISNNSALPVTFMQSATAAMDASTTYFSHVKYNGVVEGGSGQGYSGWCFRINGGFPSEREDWGASIATANINNGDVIGVYLDDPYTEATSARFTRLTLNSYSANAVSVKVTESHQAIDPETWAWTITPFINYNGVVVSLYAGTDTTATPIKTATSALGGVASFSGLNLESGVYTLKTEPVKASTYIQSTTVTKTFTIE